MAIDFSKLLADMAFKANRPKMPFRVALTYEQAQDRQRLINRVRMESPDYFAAKKLYDRINDQLQYHQNQNPGFTVELELEVEPAQVWLVACPKQGVAWGQAYSQTQIGELILCSFDAKWWPHDEATFFKACRFYGVENPEQYSFIPF
jgi:hypothetical protein